MAYPPEIIPLPVDSNGYSLDVFNKVWTTGAKNKHRQVRCKFCRSHIEWAFNVRYHCSDNMLHDVNKPENRYIDERK